RRRLARSFHRPRRRDQVADVCRKVRIAENAAAASQPCKIETQHAHAMFGKRLRHARRRQAVLAAGEAVRKNRPAARRNLGFREAPAKTIALGPVDIENFWWRFFPVPSGSNLTHATTVS